MKRTYKTAIIGCGEIAGGYDEKSDFRHTFTHAGAYKRHPRFELRAIAENRRSRLLKFQKIWNIEKAYPDYRKLLEKEELDLVSVSVPDQLHFSVVKDILEHSSAKCILEEKPIASTTKEAMELLELCRRNKASLFINYNRLWDPIHICIKKIISDGLMGKLEGSIAYYVRGIKHNGTTMISTLKFLLGCDVDKVQALKICGLETREDYAVDGLLFFNNGARVLLIAADKSGYGHSTFEIDLMGNMGRVRLIDNGFKTEIYKTDVYRRYPGVRELISISRKESSLLPKTKMNQTLLSTLDEIALSLDRGALNLKYAEEATKDLRIAEALVESSGKSGKQIKI